MVAEWMTPWLTTTARTSHTWNRLCLDVWLAVPGSELRAAIAVAGGVQHVCAAMARHVAHASVQYTGCGALRGLAADAGACVRGAAAHTVLDAKSDPVWPVFSLSACACACSHA